MEENLNQIFEQDKLYLDSRFRGFIDLLNLSESKIIDHKSNLEEERNNNPIKFEGLETYFIDLENEYPHIIFSSIFISAYSFFEYRLKFICLRIEFHHQTKLKHEDLRGNSIIDRILKFLTITLDLNKDLLNLRKLNYYRYIRNRLIHQGGIINFDETPLNEQNEMISLINADPSLEINRAKRILILNKEFVLNFVDFATTFYKKVIECIT